MSDPNDQLPIGGGTPPLVPGPSQSLEAEEKAMRGGSGGLVAMGVVAVLALVGGLVFLLMSGDDNEAYETLGRNVNGAKGELFDGFWACVFQGQEELSSNEDLQREITERASRGRERFGAMVRDRCLPKLDELEPRLEALIPPEDMHPSVSALADATRQLRGAWSDYIAFLDTQTDDYDEDAASSRVTAVARGWFEFKRAHSALNRELTGHIE